PLIAILPLAGFAFTGLVWLFISRGVYGVFASQSGLTLAVASDVSRPEKRAAAMGAVGAAFGIAFTIGPALGGWFAHHYGAPAIGYLAAGFQIASLIVVTTLLRETHPLHNKLPESEAVFVKPSSIVRLCTRPLVIGLMAVTLLATIAYSVMLPTFQPLAEDWYGWNLAEVGYGLAAFGLVGAFVQGGLIRPTVKRIGERATAIVGLVLLAAGLVWIGTHPGTTGFWSAVCLMAIGTGLASPAITSLMSLSVGEHDQGAIHGLNYSAISLGRGAGYLVGSFIFVHVSHGSAYYAGAAGAIAAGLMIVVLSRGMLRSRSQPASADVSEVQG
ncbi:MAG TPA: MFS transporter, partial [Phycisphaeraceae bacterium]